MNPLVILENGVYTLYNYTCSNCTECEEIFINSYSNHNSLINAIIDLFYK